MSKEDLIFNSYGVKVAADEIEDARNAHEVENTARWAVAEALFGVDPFRQDELRSLLAVDQAFMSAEAALRLVRQVFGSEVQVYWFWNCCQGHYAEVDSEVDGTRRQGRAGGSTIALAIMAAAVRYRLAEPEPIVENAPPAPPRNVALRVVERLDGKAK